MAISLPDSYKYWDKYLLQMANKSLAPKIFTSKANFNKIYAASTLAQQKFLESGLSTYSDEVPKTEEDKPALWEQL